MGSLVNRAHRGRVLGFVAKAKEEGAALFMGGSAHEDMAPGAYVSPTLFSGVTNGMTLAREEVFGPVGAVAHDGPEDAIAIANDNAYGLAAGIWTQNLTHAHRLARDLECGMVWVNGYMNGDMSQPWGGWKQSGQGRDKCLDALSENTQTKSVWITLGT